MTRIAAVHTALPEHAYSQAEITAAFAEVVGTQGVDTAVLARLHENAGVQTRHLAVPLERYAALDDFTKANDEFVTHAVDLGAAAVEGALTRAGCSADDVDLLMSVTVTGLAVPSIDARIVARLGMRDDVRRVPVVGLGCVAGAAGVARVHDYVLGHPDHVAVLVSIELCSLTVQHDDTSLANLVGSGLFGDGAAAVVMTGRDGPGPRVLDSRARMYPDTERVMGWDVGSSGFRIVLSPQVPDLVREHVGSDVDRFLATHDLTRDEIAWWVSHPGGPKVLDALSETLALDPDALAMTWRSLRRVGNLSSASVLHVLADTMRDRPPPPGSFGLLMAMGPGFCLEMVLLQADGEPR